jgi:hypothetical protein
MRQWIPLCCCFFLVVDNGVSAPQADPNKWERQWAGLGETLEGNELVLSDYDVKCALVPFFYMGFCVLNGTSAADSARTCLPPSRVLR